MTPAILYLIACLLFTAVPCAAQQGVQREPEAPMDIPDARNPAREPRIAVFLADGFPSVDVPPVTPAVLNEGLRGLPHDILGSVEDIKNKLKIANYDVLLLPYGSAFPSGAWTQIRAFIELGGGLVVLGGAPFYQPVRFEPFVKNASAPAASGPAGQWIPATRQPTFARDILIGPAEPVKITNETLAAVGGSSWAPQPGMPSTTWALTLRLTTKKDFDKEDGTAGPRDAVARPIWHLVRGEDGVPVGCAMIEVDRIRGSEAGGRWIFVTSDAPVEAATIRACAMRALDGASHFEAFPVDAAVDPGGQASIRVNYRKPFVRNGEKTPASLRVRVSSAGREVAVATTTLQGTAALKSGIITFQNLNTPGLYAVEIEHDTPPPSPVVARTGFWIRDINLMRGGPKVTVSRDWLRVDGAVLPVIGTTYMASDVHRKFLFEPNPWLWDRDFQQMKQHGVNFVRTGFWTGWQRAMVDPGAVDESVLNALDAYVMTAARHRIVLCFNFFAFLPPAYGAANPYLDPRALEAQKALLTAVAQRYKNCGWIHYDLINEPSYCPPEFLWGQRPIGDDFEKRAWQQWIIKNHGVDQVLLRDLWREMWGEVTAIPKPEDFNYAMVRESRRPRKAADFSKFINEVVASWAASLRETLRTAGGDVLVTLGQDEGGAWIRPAQQLYAKAVDYTAIHTWWNNDDLLWDGVVTKYPGKPNLIQETGLMRLEDLDGFPWRDMEAAARLLERKFAYSFAAGGAGSVQWAWNINPYMPIENEAVIGIWRPDGTAKPELRVFDLYNSFFQKSAGYLDDFSEQSVLIILPHSRLFSGRQRAFDGTKEMVRILSERMSVVPEAVSELSVTAEQIGASFITIVPSAEMLENRTAELLYSAAQSGKKILFTGWVGGDPYGRLTPALNALNICDPGRPVSLHEPTPYAAGVKSATLTFDDNRGQWLRASTRGTGGKFINNIWHEPLPMEHARESAALQTLFSGVFDAARVPFQSTDTPLMTRVLSMPRAALVIAVNESVQPVSRTITVNGIQQKIHVEPGRSAMLLVERQSGKVLASFQ